MEKNSLEIHQAAGNCGYKLNAFKRMLLSRKRNNVISDAGKIVISKGTASIGCLQRYLKIGFNRAARIMDELYDAGVVGEEESTPVQQSQTFSDDRIILYNNKFDYMEGHDFENYCALLLQNNGFDHVTVTKGSGDQGIPR